MDDRTLGHVLAVLATDLDGRGFPYAGPLRQAARRLHEIANGTSDGCRRCGEPLTQPATGRRKVFCSTRCRQLDWHSTKAVQ